MAKKDLKNNRSKYLLYLKIVVVLCMLIYLAYKIYNASIISNFKTIDSFNTSLFLVTFFMVVFNWGFEAKKWKLLMAKNQKINFITAYKSVLAGLASGLLTPNRLGNFIGRLSYVNSNNKSIAIFNTTLGNMAQFIVTVLFGVIGLLFTINITFIHINVVVILCIAVFFLALSIYLYFNPGVLIKIKFIKKFLPLKLRESILFFSNQLNQLKLSILLLSSLRYFIFCLQFYLLFITFGVDLPTLTLFGLIALNFLLTTIIPSPLFGKLFVRESVAIFVFSIVDINLVYILLVVFLLWLINLALPALLGGILWLNVKND